MGIKETPTNFRVYYTCMRQSVEKEKADAISSIDELTSEIVSLHAKIDKNYSIYFTQYEMNIQLYPEYAENRYINGEFYRVTKSWFSNTEEKNIDPALWDLYNLATKQKDIYDLQRDIEHYDKLLNLSLKQYTEILRVYYTEVQKQMILNGAGYAFEGSLGWICINRCRIEKQTTRIDFAKTKKRKAELIAKGEKIRNVEEERWCKERGIEYKGVDPRVFLKNEYCYEIPLLDCKIPHGSKFRFVAADYRGNALRGKTNEDILNLAEYDPETLCKMPLDIRTKLNLCVVADKTLYAKFIRNENQKPINSSKASWKNRQ